MFDSEGLNNIGWGIRLREGPHVALISTILFVVFLVAGLVFGVCWSVLRHSASDAFTISGFIASIGSLGLIAWTSWTAA
jgi:hypothetical protein